MKEKNDVKQSVVDESNINGFFVWKVAFIAAMGGLLFGYDFMVIGGATIFYEKFFDLVGSPQLLGLSVASAPIGCILGAAFSMFFVGIAITHLLIGLSFHYEQSGIWIVLLVLVAIALYALTLAPVMWVLLSEIFPNRVRGVALGISVVTLWVAYLILTYTFPIMRESMGTAKTFWVYSAFLFIAFFVIKVALPETKGKSLEQIERDLLK